MGFAIKGEFNVAFVAPGNHTLPAEVNIGSLAGDIERDFEGVVALFYFEVGDLRCNRRPVLIADRRVDTSENLMLADANVPQEHVVRIEDHRDRASTQRNWFARARELGKRVQCHQQADDCLSKQVLGHLIVQSVIDFLICRAELLKYCGSNPSAFQSITLRHRDRSY